MKTTAVILATARGATARGATAFCLLLAAAPSLAGPAGTHETSKSHSANAMIWCESSTWSGAGPSTQKIADNAQLTTGWTLLPEEIGGNLMFSYASMNGAMNTVTQLDASAITGYSVEFTRDQAGLPPVLGVTMNSQVIDGAGGFRMALAAPLPMTLALTRFEATADPGLYLAIYSGMRAPAQWLVTDPGFGGAPIAVVGDAPEPYELGILTAVPEPASALATLAALGGAALRRARRR